MRRELLIRRLVSFSKVAEARVSAFCTVVALTEYWMDENS
jgi:hypothetical protein